MFVRMEHSDTHIKLYQIRILYMQVDPTVRTSSYGENKEKNSKTWDVTESQYVIHRQVYCNISDICDTQYSLYFKYVISYIGCPLPQDTS